MRFTLYLSLLLSTFLLPAQGGILNFLNTTNNGKTFVYEATVQNNQQVDTGSYIVIFDFAGLVSGQGPSPIWEFSIETNVANQPDNPLITDARFTYTGTTPILGVPGGTSLGTFTLTTSADMQQQGTYLFETIRSDGGNAGAILDNLSTTTVAAGSNAVPEPAAMLLVGGGLTSVGLFRRRKSCCSMVV